MNNQKLTLCPNCGHLIPFKGIVCPNCGKVYRTLRS